MSDSAIDRKRAVAEHALENGGVPAEPYPGHLTWLLRACVERGEVSGLGWLCRMFPEHERAIVEHWCRLGGRRLWAWREARERLEGLVARKADIELSLRRFALVPPPPAPPGSAPEASKTVVLELLVRGLVESGYDSCEVNAQFGESFPRRGDPGDRLEKRRDKAGDYLDGLLLSDEDVECDATVRKHRAEGRPYASALFNGCDAEGDASSPSRPLAIDVDWDDPEEACVALLLCRWPVFALMWDFWPERRDAHLALWCARAEREAWVWAEVEALRNHAIYCGWSLPSPLWEFVSVARPANPSNRPAHHGRWVRVAAIEAHCAEKVKSQSVAEDFVRHAFERARARRKDPVSRDLRRELRLDLDPSWVRRNFIEGREQLKGVIAYTSP